MNTNCNLEHNHVHINSNSEIESGILDCESSILQIWDIGVSKKILEIKDLSGSIATPFLRDLDKDGKLDLVLNVNGIVLRYDFNSDINTTNIHWNHFRGPFRQGRI
jgi:hypothetical protein